MNLPTSTFQFIYYFVRQQKAKFAVFVLGSTIWAINDTVFPYFIKRIVDVLQSYDGAREGIYIALKGILILLAVFWLVTEILQRLEGIVAIYTFPQFRANIREVVFNYVKSHSHEYFSTHFAGNIAKKLADLPTSSQTIMEIICYQFVTTAAGAVVILVMMWLTQPLFAVILLVWMVIHFLLTAAFLRFGNDLWETHSESVSVLSGKIVDVFSNILNVRLFARGKYEEKLLKKYQRDEIKKAKKAMWVMEITKVGLGINGLLLIFMMLLTLVHGWVHHWITIGDFTQVGMQTFWILGWIAFVSYQMTIFARETATVGSALTIIKKGHDLVDQPGAKPIVIASGKIGFENVTFSYQKKRKVFKNLNVDIAAGQKIGLVGFSGSGKSTFVNLILRFYDLNSGRILIDGVDIAGVTQDSLRSQIAMIPQDPALFHRSLMENIRYGRLDATDEEVIAAARLANCEEFIAKLEEGYHSMVGERGVKLSGGQRQRIAIARAILKNAPILILDEATSALDSVTEKLIQDSLHHLMQGRTTIVVAHRLSTLSDMDKILVFDKGKIVEEGPQADLLQNDGHFAALWNMQINGFLPEN
jgi:ATP-binding cassette subfamily B protein